MKPVSAEIVSKTWQEMGAMSIENVPSVIHEMEKKQPALLAYLLAVFHEILNEDERQLLLYLGLVVWKIMSTGEKPLKKISLKELNKKEEKNLKMLEYLEAENDLEKTVQEIFVNYNQKEILKYILEALIECEEDEEEETDIRNENTGIMVIALITVIDCLDQ